MNRSYQALRSTNKAKKDLKSQNWYPVRVGNIHHHESFSNTERFMWLPPLQYVTEETIEHLVVHPGLGNRVVVENTLSFLFCLTLF